MIVLIKVIKIQILMKEIFYKKITPEMLKEINDWFEERKQK